MGMFSTMLFFMGQFTLFTYLRPFLEVVTGLQVGQLSLVLLAMGFLGLLGTFVIGHLLKDRLFSLLIIIPLLMTGIAAALIAFGHSLMAVYALLSLWGFLGTSAPVAWWTWLSKTLPADAEAGGGLMVAVIQLAITCGAAGGGIVYDAYGYEYTFSMSAFILLAASFTAFLAWKMKAEKFITTAIENPI